MHRNYLLFVGSARWIKRIIALSPISTTNTIDMLISMIIKGFVVTGCPISSPLFRLILAQPAAYIPLPGYPYRLIGSCPHCRFFAGTTHSPIVQPSPLRAFDVAHGQADSADSPYFFWVEGSGPTDALLMPAGYNTLPPFPVSNGVIFF